VPATELQLGAIGQIASTVSDMPRAVAFYRDAVGLRQLPIPAPPSMAFFDCAGIRLMLSLPEAEVERAGSVLYFRVADIQQAYEALRARGVSFVDEPHLIARLPEYELWMTFFRDPDGNPLALMCESRVER
jgi:methylmalonyl-CoA/ethylmalonyl-CoA epimerase